MSQSFTLAHFSDPHMGPIVGLEMRYCNIKRALGLINWTRKRRRLHQMPLLARIVADLKAQAPDHIALTGDLANLGLPGEHAQALAWLVRFGSGAEVSVVPGNHDPAGHARWRCPIAAHDYSRR